MRGLRAGQLNVVLRDHRYFRGRRRDPRLGQCFLNLFECIRRSHDVPRGAIVLQVFGARFQHEIQQLVFGGRFLGHRDLALAVEHPPDGAGFGQVAAVLAHKVAKLADDAVAVRGYHLNQHAYAARAVAFKRSFLVLLAFQLAGAAKNRALDVLIRHIFVLCRQNRRAKARVGVWFATADARSDGNFPDDSRESAAALRVGGRFLVFNCGPF